MAHGSVSLKAYMKVNSVWLVPPPPSYSRVLRCNVIACWLVGTIRSSPHTHPRAPAGLVFHHLPLSTLPHDVYAQAMLAAHVWLQGSSPPFTRRVIFVPSSGLGAPGCWMLHWLGSRRTPKMDGDSWSPMWLGTSKGHGGGEKGGSKTATYAMSSLVCRVMWRVSGPRNQNDQGVARPILMLLRMMRNRRH